MHPLARSRDTEGRTAVGQLADTSSWRPQALASALEEPIRSSDRALERRARQVLAKVATARGDVASARRLLEPAFQPAADRPSEVHAVCVLTPSAIDLAAGDLEDAVAGAEGVVAGDFGRVPYLGTEARMLLELVMFERGEGNRRYARRIRARNEHSSVSEICSPTDNSPVELNLRRALRRSYRASASSALQTSTICACTDRG